MPIKIAVILSVKNRKMIIQNLTLLSLVLSCISLSAQSKGKLTVVVQPEIEKLQKTYIRHSEKEASLEGYRVQIYNGKKEACLKVRSEFLRKYPNVSPYTLYESPEYRVQVGDFRTRLEAEKFLRKIIHEFRGSFVLKTKIKLPELEADVEVVDMQVEMEK